MRIQAALSLLFVVLSFSAARAQAPAAPPAPASAAVTATGPLPVEAFYGRGAMTDAALSPNGQYVAAVMEREDGVAIYVYDLAAGHGAIVSGIKDIGSRIDWVRWKGDDRLLISVSYREVAWKGKTEADRIYGRSSVSLMTMNRDGTGRVVLLKADQKASRLIDAASYFGGYDAKLVDPLPADPDHVLMWTPTNMGAGAIWKADVHTGAGQLLEQDREDGIGGWSTDSDGAVVARSRTLSGTEIVEGRAPGDTAWFEITRIAIPTWKKDRSQFDIIGPTDHPGQVYVLVRPKDASVGEYATLNIYDVRARKLSPTAWNDLPDDITQVVRGAESNRVIGACYVVDVLDCRFAAPHDAAVFKALNRYFEGDSNVLPVSRSADGRWWLLEVTAPDEPGAYYLYDDKTHDVKPFGEMKPSLPMNRLGRMERFSFKARDGTTIPGYLTTPPDARQGGKPLPLVVLPHGGPNARDAYDYDGLVQFLATRGYAVLQVNFRGSAGYGAKWLEAGYGQWAGLMLDDLDDGVAAAIATGRIDRTRVCAVGASYGGYAALMLGVRHPDLYKCVVSWAGLTDLNRLLKEEAQSGHDSESYQYTLRRLGGAAATKEALQAASPLTYVARYGPPILLLQGKRDDIVQPEQAEAMQIAMRRAGKPMQVVMVEGEGHPYWKDYNMRIALTDIADFLKAHIAPAN